MKAAHWWRLMKAQWQERQQCEVSGTQLRVCMLPVRHHWTNTDDLFLSECFFFPGRHFQMSKAEMSFPADVSVPPEGQVSRECEMLIWEEKSQHFFLLDF